MNQKLLSPLKKLVAVVSLLALFLIYSFYRVDGSPMVVPILNPNSTSNGILAYEESYPPPIEVTPDPVANMDTEFYIMDNTGPYAGLYGPFYSGSVTPIKDIGQYPDPSSIPDSYYTVGYLDDYGLTGSGCHPGVDIVKPGTDCLNAPLEVSAIMSGTVYRVVELWFESNCALCANNQNPLDCGSWGNYVIIKHEGFHPRNQFAGPPVFSTYAHLKRVRDEVTEGGVVLRGTPLGYQGSTGNSSGPHLHFQLDNGRVSTIPYWPPRPQDRGLDEWCSSDLTNWQNYVKYNTVDPMSFVDAHKVTLAFYGYPYGWIDQTSPEALGWYDYFPELDFQWGLTNSFYGDIGHPESAFSTSLLGLIEIIDPGYYNFYVTHDDGVRIWIWPQNTNFEDTAILLTDSYSLTSYPRNNVNSVELGLGYYHFKVEYYKSACQGCGSVFQVGWMKNHYRTFFPSVYKMTY